MKGLELSRQFYLAYGAPMLEEQFSAITPLLAVGLVGSGSECFGYDDELSQDHDFEPGFCLFLPGEDVISSREAFALERAYAKLPKEFMGYKRSPLNPVGGNRHGVLRLSDFLRERLGNGDGCLAPMDWFYLPEQAVAEVTNGCIFRDDAGIFTTLREVLAYMPEDVRLKKLAGNLLLMGQAGQYNYSRCVARGELGAAQLAMAEFVKAALHVLFLLNRRYMPYYKWRFRALRELPLLSTLEQSLTYLLASGNGEAEATKKTAMVEHVCAEIIAVLREQDLTAYAGGEMEGHAYAVNDRIQDASIRNLHVLYAVDN